MKVVENRDEPFSKDITSYYVRNTDDNRSRRDRWNAKKFVRSDLRPGYFRTASKNADMRYNSNFSDKDLVLGIIQDQEVRKVIQDLEVCQGVKLNP